MIGQAAASEPCKADGTRAAGDALGVVVIGRNEGARLVRCFASLVHVPTLVYVDSGSTDGSVPAAQARGIRVVELPVPPAFTAARARNAGVLALRDTGPDVTLVQTIDGDCELDPGWIAAARAAMESEADLAAVLGRLRERHPERSIYNAMCDDEWNAPIGEAEGFGGIAMLRMAALQDVDGYRETMIAGEDSEMAMRMRKRGWRIRRIDAEMALHDADILRFGQWWRRTVRSGYAFAEMALLHPDARWPNWPRTRLSILTWGAAIPLALLASIAATVLLGRPWVVVSFALLLASPAKMLQIARAKRRAGLSWREARGIGVLLMIGKIAQMQGLVRFHLGRLFGRGPRLIEYKGAAARGVGK